MSPASVRYAAPWLSDCLAVFSSVVERRTWSPGVRGSIPLASTGAPVDCSRKEMGARWRAAPIQTCGVER